MKNTLLAIFISLFAITAYAQVHDKTLDGKSISSVTFDDANAPGTVKVQGPSGNASNYTITLPAETGTLVTTASTVPSQYIQSSGINWIDVNGVKTITTGINWIALPNIVQSSNVNWANVNGLQPVNTGGINWATLVQNITSAAVNWTNVNGTQTITTGINWMALPNIVQTTNINWVDQQFSTPSGVNWFFVETSRGGINWNKVSNGATSTNIVCWKSTGQLGKCTTGVSGVNCTACN